MGTQMSLSNGLWRGKQCGGASQSKPMFKAASPPVGRMEMPATVDKDDLSPTASRRQAGDGNEWSRSFLGLRRLM